MSETHPVKPDDFDERLRMLYRVVQLAQAECTRFLNELDAFLNTTKGRSISESQSAMLLELRNIFLEATVRTATPNRQNAHDERDEDDEDYNRTYDTNRALLAEYSSDIEYFDQRTRDAKCQSKED